MIFKKSTYLLFRTVWILGSHNTDISYILCHERRYRARFFHIYYRSVSMPKNHTRRMSNLMGVKMHKE